MKTRIFLSLLGFLASSCSKITQDRLEGTWNVVEIKEKNGTLDFWEKWLDTTQVKVAFLSDATEKTFYFEDDSLVGYSSGAYLLLEEEAELVISDTSIVFNSHGLPFEVTELKKNKMTLEGKYYLHGVIPSLPPDSFTVLRWTFEN